MDSVTVPVAGTVNYSWDVAGNMTGEGATTYQYDAAGRMVSVNNGSGGSYGFDGDGKRVKKAEGSTVNKHAKLTHYPAPTFDPLGGSGQGVRHRHFSLV